jgi:hypothetical protein
LVLYLEEPCPGATNITGGWSDAKALLAISEGFEEHLPSEHHQLLRNSLYLAILGWYTDGVEPREAAARISHAVAG